MPPFANFVDKAFSRLQSSQWYMQDQVIQVPIVGLNRIEYQDSTTNPQYTMFDV